MIYIGWTILKDGLLVSYSYYNNKTYSVVDGALVQSVLRQRKTNPTKCIAIVFPIFRTSNVFENLSSKSY